MAVMRPRSLTASSEEPGGRRQGTAAQRGGPVDSEGPETARPPGDGVLAESLERLERRLVSATKYAGQDVRRPRRRKRVSKRSLPGAEVRLGPTFPSRTHSENHELRRTPRSQRQMLAGSHEPARGIGHEVTGSQELAQGAGTC